MEDEIYIKMNNVERNHWWFEGRRNIVKSVIKSLKLPENAMILDVGCGTGGNLLALSKFGEVVGVEMSEEAIRLAREKKVGKILKGHLPNQLPQLKEKFHLIVLLDVLEHIENDVDTLKVLRSYLAPNGYIILTVPALPLLWSQHDVEHHHERRYLMSSLSKCIYSAGLSIEHITFYNFLLLLPIAIVRLAEKTIHNKQIGSNIRVPNRIINFMLQKIFSIESFFVRLKLPIGVSLLAIITNKEQ